MCMDKTSGQWKCVKEEAFQLTADRTQAEAERESGCRSAIPFKCKPSGICFLQRGST